MKKIFLIIFCSVMFLSMVNGWTTNQFNNSLTRENLTFTGSGTNTRYLQVPEGINITYAYLNISKVLVIDYRCNQEQSTVSGSCGGYSNGSYFIIGGWDHPENANNSNWNDGFQTRLLNTTGTYIVNYSKNNSFNGAIFNIRASDPDWSINFEGQDDGNGRMNLTLPDSCYFNGLPFVSLKFNASYSTDDSWIHCWNVSNTWEMLAINTEDDIPDFYEESITWLVQNRISNVNLSVNNLQFYYSHGNFTQTNNKTNNFASQINSYLGNCNNIDGYCNVPINFKSSSSGILEYLDLFAQHIAIMNITFSTTQNVTINYEGGTRTFVNNQSIYMNLSEIGIGYVTILYNEGEQFFTFYNDNETDIVEYLIVENPTIIQNVKVVSSGSIITDARVEFLKIVSGSHQSYGQAYTDVNGIARINLQDTDQYLVEVSKEGYNDYSEYYYVQTGNTETYIVSLNPIIGTDTEISETWSNCKGSQTLNQNCSFGIYSTKVFSTIRFEYLWNGSWYNATTDNMYNATLTLVSNNVTNPINVSIYGEEVLKGSHYTTWANFTITNRVNIDLDYDELKSNTRILILAYIIIIFIGIILWLIFENTKMKSWGVPVMGIWLTLMALNGFEILWFPVSTAITYYIFDAYWGEE